MEAIPFAVPNLLSGAASTATEADGWVEDRQHYRVRPRARPKFKAVLDAHTLFGGGEVRSQVITRVGRNAEGRKTLELEVEHVLSGRAQREKLVCNAEAGLVAEHFSRHIDGPQGQGHARIEEVAFLQGPFDLPRATYPEVCLPFLMRGQPLDGQVRSAWSWTNDRFIARVYYEVRGTSMLTVPAGRFQAAEVWMYPDLNDWISLGSILTKLAKPLLPRYNMWFEVDAPHRVLRFEGPYGPPAAPEVELELIHP